MDFEEIIFKKTDVRIGDTIGEGNFGRVHKAILKNKGGKEKEVAVKYYSEICLDDEKKKLFHKEATNMMRLDHPNVMCLIGIVFLKPGLPSLIMPLMEKGDLLKYI